MADTIKVIDANSIAPLYRTVTREFYNPDGTPDTVNYPPSGQALQDIPSALSAIEYEYDAVNGATKKDNQGMIRVALDENGQPKHGPIIMTWNPNYYCVNPEETDPELQRFRGAWVAYGGAEAYWHWYIGFGGTY